MASFQTTTAREHQEKLLETRKAQQEQLKSVVDDLDASVFGVIQEIRSLTDADGLSDTQKVIEIRTLLDRGQSSAFERLKADLHDTTQDRSGFEVGFIPTKIRNPPQEFLLAIESLRVHSPQLAAFFGNPIPRSLLRGRLLDDVFFHFCAP